MQIGGRIVVLVLWVAFGTQCLSAKGFPCGEFARRAVDLPFYFEQLKDVSPAQISRVSDRALFVVGTCPDDFYYQLSTIPEIFDLWVTQLKGTVQSKRFEARDRYIRRLGVELREQKTEREYIRMRDAILAVISGMPKAGTDLAAGAQTGWRCGSFAEAVDKGILEDWKGADGAEWKVLSDDLMFSLAVCPDQLYSAFTEERPALDQWLSRVGDFSFGATPEYAPILKAFREQLVSSLKSRATKPQFKPIQEAICNRLRTAKIRIID